MSEQSRRVLRTALIVLFAVIFCVCLYVLIRVVTDYKNGGDIYEKARSEFIVAETETAQIPSDGPQIPSISIDFKGLKEVCPDAVGWLLIENTTISYPIVQGEDNKVYLHTTYDGHDNISGSIFIDSGQKTDLTEKNTIIYGNNMKNGTMFGDLTGYCNVSFYNEHKYVFIITESGILTYEVFSAYITDDLSAAYTKDFESPEDYVKFLNFTVENSWIAPDDPPADGDMVITLSTSTENAERERFVVHAKLIQD